MSVPWSPRFASSSEPKVFIIHEHDAWLEPLVSALQAANIPFEPWFLSDGGFDFSLSPPEGIFYNRMSASSHTRNHRYAAELTSTVLPWLQMHGRRVLNGAQALQLEVNKMAQYAALSAAGVRVPRTLAAVGHPSLLEQARQFPAPFITKHNRAGKGLGVKLYHSYQALADDVQKGAVEPSVDGVTLLQQYIASPKPYITRVELIGRQLVYAVRADTTQGFELCPADVCAVGDMMCPASANESNYERFKILENFNAPFVQDYMRVMQSHDMHIAAFEFILDQDHVAYTYDINTNTNYNREAELRAGSKLGMEVLAGYLGDQLQAYYGEHLQGVIRRNTPTSQATNSTA